MSSQNNLERIASLLILFKENSSLTKKEIYSKLKDFYFESTLKDKNKQTMEASANKKFERDKKLLQELGYNLVKIGKDIYKITDFEFKNSFIEYFSKEEKKILSDLLLNEIMNSAKEYIFLYLKLFYKDYEILNNLLKSAAFKKLKHVNLLNFQNNNIKDKILSLIFGNKKPMEIKYIKKNNEVIQRNIFPISIYLYRNLEYLIAWDYEKDDLRSFIMENIKSINVIKNHKKFDSVKIINKKNLDIKKEKNVIEIPYMLYLKKLPHPLNITSSKEKKEIEVELTIKKEYYDLYKKFINFSNRNIYDFKRKGADEVKNIIQFNLVNIQGLFDFMIQYPDSIIDIKPDLIKEKFLVYLEELSKFYNENIYYGI